MCSDAAAVAAMIPKGSLQATGVSLDARFRTSVGGALTVDLGGGSPNGVSLAAVDAGNDNTTAASVNNAEREAAVDSQLRSSTAAATAAAERAAAVAAAQAAAAADVATTQATEDWGGDDNPWLTGDTGSGSSGAKRGASGKRKKNGTAGGSVLEATALAATAAAATAVSNSGATGTGQQATAAVAASKGKKGPMELTQEELIARAFAAPDVEAEFKEAKVRVCLCVMMACV
jgi:Utp14 protein